MPPMVLAWLVWDMNKKMINNININISHILAAGWYLYLASTLEYSNHIYQKKLEKCCTLSTLYCLLISDPSKKQNTILKVARQ